MPVQASTKKACFFFFGVGGGGNIMWIYLETIQRSFYLCGHLSAKPGSLLSSKHDSR